MITHDQTFAAKMQSYTKCGTKSVGVWSLLFKDVKGSLPKCLPFVKGNVAFDFSKKIIYP